MRRRLRRLEVESGFKEDEADVEVVESDEDEEEIDPEAMEPLDGPRPVQ